MESTSNKNILLVLAILVTACITWNGCRSNNNSIPTKKENNNNPDSTIHKNEIQMAWDSSTLTRVSSHTKEANYSGYARIIQLHDGSLICVYEVSGSVVVVKSNDKGVTWSDAVMVASKEPGIKMSTPDILELRDQSLLIAYNPRPTPPFESSKRFAIRTKKSDDKGKNWKDEHMVYKAGYRPVNGCWEPSLVQLPSGEVQLYFSNEGIFTQSNEQNISLFRSEDGGQTWTGDPEVVSYRAGARDGMPVPLVLQNSKQLAVSIEDNGGANFKPYIVRSTLENDWSKLVRGDSKNRSYALANKISPNDYAGAPYLVQLKSGKTLLSYQGTEGRQPNGVKGAEMKVVIGNKKARDFKHKSVPFNIPSNSNGVWNSLAVLKDSTVIALTTTNAYSINGNTEVWMIKGHVKRK